MKLSSIALTFGLAAISSISCAQSATYMIEPTHTYVTWEAKHFGTSTSRGRFDKKAGSITLDKTAKTGSVDVAIQTDSINTGFSVFDKHKTQHKNNREGKETEVSNNSNQKSIFTINQCKN